jgi:Protein of unknown function (DUF3253)
MPSFDSPAALATILLDLCASAPTGSSISPIDAAKAFAEACGEDELGWRSHLSAVRRAAIRLAQEGQLVIYRKGKVADPNDFRGVYRLGAPRQD